MPRKQGQLQDPDMDMIAVPVLLPKWVVSALTNAILPITKNSLEDEIQRAVLVHVARLSAAIKPVVNAVLARREATRRRA